MPSLILPAFRRQALGFPVGRVPGVDPAHPAAPGLLLSAVAAGLNFRRVNGSGLATYAAGGAGATAQTESILGPAVIVDTGFFANPGGFTFSGLNAPAAAPGTLAAIFKVTAAFGNDAILLSLDAAGTNTNSLFLGDGVGNLYTVVGGFDATGFQLAVNVPYFLVWTWQDSANGKTQYVALTNLATGLVQIKASIANGNTGAATVLAIGNAAGGSFRSGAQYAAAMVSLTYLGPQQVQAWAYDPWAFWYPGSYLPALELPWIAPATAGPNTYTLAIGAGTYTVTGAAVTPAVAVPVGASSYAATGAAITLGAGSNVAAGAYAYTGAAVTPAVALPVGSGSYVYTGAATGITVGAGSNVAAGAYTYTGSAVTLAVALPVAAGSYSSTGAAVTLGAGLNVGAGSYVYSGQLVTLNRGVNSAVAAGTYSSSGAAVGLGAGLNVGAGSYSVTGGPLTLAGGLGVGSGSYNVTGFPVGLGAGLNVGAGTYAYTGATVRLDVGMGVGAGSYVYTGAAVQLIYTPIGPHNYVLAIGLGNYVYNGQPVGLVDIPFGPPTGSFGVSGKNVACNYGVSGQGTVFGFSNPVNPFATVVLETDR